MRKSKKRKVIMFLIFILMIILFLYILLNSNIFNSKNIKIEGNNKITNEEIISILNIKEDKNIFRYNLNDMKKILEKENYIKDVKIDRIIPDKLHIMIIEKEIAGALKNGKEYYYVDEDINLIEKAGDLDNMKEKIIIECDYNINKEKIIEFKNDKQKEIISSLLKDIKSNNLNNKVNKIIYSDNNIKITANKEIEIILPNNKNIGYNIKMTAMILADLQSNNIKKGTVDFTYINNPIYRP